MGENAGNYVKELWQCIRWVVECFVFAVKVDIKGENLENLSGKNFPYKKP